MIYRDFQGEKLSMLGFGTMRLPLLGDGSIDEKQVAEMTRHAIGQGVNYFDTAYPYHGGRSELVIGKVLKDYPRDSYYLADKYPGHQISDHYDPAAVFEDQLKKCGVDYFDFYLLHNVYENDIEVYKDPKWGIMTYFDEQRRAGRIRHLGFSTHARPETLRAFLEWCRDAGIRMEFCQIQMNYVDWTLQDARQKVDILNEFGVPIWVMEPVKGGRLARLTDSEIAELPEESRKCSPASLALRFLQDIPGVTVVLSGMSDAAQMRENTETFEREKPLSAEEREALLGIAEGMKNDIPCTACRYCCAGCPAELNIPMLIAALNDVRFGGGNTPIMQMEALPEDRLPSACVNCGQCAAICPQKIDVPAAMAELAERFAKAVKWTEICRQREEAARKLREESAN